MRQKSFTSPQLKIHAAQTNFTVGALEENADKIISIVRGIDSPTCKDVVVFPELSISGYPPLDLLDSYSFYLSQQDQVKRVIKETKDFPGLIIFGILEANKGNGKLLHNSAIVVKNEEVIYTYKKRLLPTYDVFDEARYFEPGDKPGYFAYEGYRIGLLICEDLWYDEKNYKDDPARDLFEANVDLIISTNASPSVLYKRERREKLVYETAQKYEIPILYLNQVGANDSIVFDGGSFIADEYGIIVKRAPSYEETIFEVWIDNGRVLLDKNIVAEAKNKGIKDYGNIHNLNHIEMSEGEFFYQQVKIGIRDYFDKLGCFKGIVIGSSGGIDSAVALAMAADAIGPEKVFAITMPSQYSSDGSVTDSEKLCSNLGIELRYLPIKDMYNAIYKPFHKLFGEESNELISVTEQNIQARIRGLLLMAFSNQFGHLLVSTGNKSEMSVGYCTLYGDMNGGLAPLSDLYKMEVYELARYYNQLHNKELIPQAIIDKAPSAELAPGQEDTDSLPPYPLLDARLKVFLEGEKAYGEKFYEILKTQNEMSASDYHQIDHMVMKNEFKRKQAPITIKIHEKAFGIGRRVPIVHKWKGR